MTEAASSAPAAAPTTIDTPATPANDNATGSAPVAANDNAQAAESIFDADNLGDFADRKWRLKNGDKERVVDTRELFRLSQIGHSGYEKFREAADKERTVQEAQAKFDAQRRSFDQALRSDILGVIRQLGLEDTLLDAYQQEQAYRDMPPDQRARADIQRERQRLEQQQRAWQQQQQQAQQQAREAALRQQTEQARAKFVADYGAALDAVGVPQDENIRRTAFRLMAGEHERRFNEGVPIEALARDAAEQLRSLGLAFKPSPEKAREIYGEDWVRGVQQHDVQRVQQTRKTPPQGPDGKFVSANAAQPERQRRAFSSMRDFRKALDGK